MKAVGDGMRSKKEKKKNEKLGEKCHSSQGGPPQKGSVVYSNYVSVEGRTKYSGRFAGRQAEDLKRSFLSD